MRTSSLTLIAAAILAGGSFGVLAGCSEAPADESAVTPVPPLVSTARKTAPFAAMAASRFGRSMA